MKLLRLLILITVRQTYLLLANLYHLLTSPRLAFKTLLATRDKSQIFLLSLVFISPTLAYLSGRIFWDFYRFGHPLLAIGQFFYFTVFFQSLILLFLLYSVFKTIKHA